MALLPGYEYDIFISYRHNDNLDGWVSGFVEALEKELKATIKEPVSIYFDKNPHDGLLETHHVDKSLEGKLKCLIFIPIISQTYCDEKSFAWQQEFCVFNALAKGDELGRDVRLLNGNVASRILPVKVHDLDATDKATVEKEMGGALRAIEFIYKEPGVNRPLKPTDNRSDNQIKTDYRNQINKVANAVKELTTALKSPRSPATTNHHEPTAKPTSSGKKILAALGAVILLATAYFFYQQRTTTAQPPALDKSIAVLPFTNMTNDSTQNYFTDGMADDILNHLSKIADLRVKSRTSTLQYRNTSKTMPQIAEELGAGTILEGSVRKVGSQVRIVVQLIDARNDVHIWSETYDRPLEDVLKLQSEIAMAVSKKLAATLTPVESDMIQKQVSANLTAYDYFLKARDLSRKPELFNDNIEAQRLFRKAVELDPDFAEAYAEWSLVLVFDESRNVRRTKDSALLLANKAIELDARLGEAYYARYYCNFFINRFAPAFDDLKSAYRYSPNNSDILFSLGSNYYRAGNYMEGARLRLKGLQLQGTKNSLNYLLRLAEYYQLAGEIDRAKDVIEEARISHGSNRTLKFIEAGLLWGNKEFDRAEELYEELAASAPGHWREQEFALWMRSEAFLRQRNYKKAKELLAKYTSLEANRPDTTLKTDFRHKLGYILCLEGNTREGLKLIYEDIDLHKRAIQPYRTRSYYIGIYQFNLAAMFGFLNDSEQALHYLDSAFLQESYQVEQNPMFDNLRKRPEFQQLYKRKQRHWQLNQAAMKQALREFEAGTL